MAPSPNSRRHLKIIKPVLIFLLTGACLVCLAVLSLPYWLGSALKLATHNKTIHFDDYQREGYSQFVIEGFSFDHPQATIEIDELHAFSPLVWLLKSRNPGGEDPFLRIGKLVVRLPEAPPVTPEASTSAGPQHIGDALDLLERSLSQTDTWLPRATIEHIHLFQGTRELEISEVEWANRILTFNGQLNDFPEYPFSSRFDLHAPVPVMNLQIPDADLALNASLTRESDSYLGQARIRFRENVATLTSTFTNQGWLPESANWKLEDWSLNLESLGVISPYPLLSFTLNGGWTPDGLQNTLDGRLAPENDSENLLVPPMDFQTEIGGNFEALNVSKLYLDTPGLSARMSEPITYDVSTRSMTGDLRLDIDFDLSLLKRDDLKGQLVGFLDLREQAGKPSGQFTLQGVDVILKAYEFEALDIQAQLDWPELDIQTLDAKLTTGTEVALTGQIDIEAREIIATTLRGILTRETLVELLPKDLTLDNVSYSASATGPFDAIRHEGTLEIDSFETPTLQPLSVAIDWSGQQNELESMRLIAQSETGELKLMAAGILASGPMAWTIQELQLASNGIQLANLKQPAHLTLDPQQSSNVIIESLALVGAGGELLLDGQLAYPESADVTLELANINPQEWSRPWLKKPAPSITFNQLSAQGGWDNGPALFDLRFNTTMAEENRAITAHGDLSSDGMSLEFENIEISDQDGPWVTLAGHLPIRIHPAGEPIFQIGKDESIDLLFTSSESQYWLNWLSEVSPYDFERFASQIQLQGSLNDLTGSFEVKLLTRANPEEYGIPATFVMAQGAIENTLLTISNMTVTVAEENFDMRGSVDLPTSLLTMLDDPTTSIPWEETTFNLKIPPSKLTPLLYLAPQLLSTGGEIEADFSGSIADGVSGFFRIKDVNTRAIFPFGSLRGISADLTFENSQANLKNISAFIGREPVTVTGTLDYRNWRDPNYQFTILGNDLPLIRKPGLLLRSDLDLAIKKQSSTPTTVSGNVGLKNGLFLLNRNSILGGGSAGGRTAQTRPPFFSVEAPPVSEWVLDIAVKGDRFIRLRTPAADGTLSLDMKLQGKLKEPFATGRLEFDEGNLYFPFSSFTIDYGIAELPVDDPYSPSVELLGSSRRFGYDISVEITGSAYDPQIHFSSNPPLSSEQIMLMVMAGENPDGMFDYTGAQRASKLGTYFSKGLFASGDSGSGFLSRLSIDSGENLSEQGKETMEIEYRLDDQFQLVGEYDEYDFWNVGLRWQILQREVLNPEPEDVKE